MSDNEVIRLIDVWVYYGEIPTLEAITLSVKQQDFLGIIGPNGGGKTTLLKVLLGLVKPSRGTITVLGGPPEQTRKYVGYVPQYTLFDPEFPISAWDVVLMGRLGRTCRFRRYTKEDRRITRHMLQFVEMEEFRDHPLAKLSGGQKQRVLIARALVTEPKLLLLDEPTANIDPEMQTHIYDLLHELNEKIPIILVSHDIGALSEHVNKIACLNQRLFYHNSKELTEEMLQGAYSCAVQLIAHGIPHRVLKEHS
ncbi:MAG: metal ABC transporter ATP-binding protein [Candidatus Hodarchaeota archaeon]